MPIIRLGNTAAKEGYREDVEATEWDDLVVEAGRRGVVYDDLDPADGATLLRERVNGVVKFRPIEGQQITTINVPDGTPFLEALTTVVARNGVWNYHSDEPPAWVESNDAELESAIAKHYGCAIGMPEDWPGPAGANWGTEPPQIADDNSESDREGEEAR